jgi:hypothetical protein
MGRTGACWDNAAAESFFATLKNEMYHRYRFTTRARARFAVAEYIEVFYPNQAAQHPGLQDARRSPIHLPDRCRGLTADDHPETVQNP